MATKFIKRWDFSKGDDLDKFDDARCELNTDVYKESDLREALTVFQRHVCHARFPVSNKGAAKFAGIGLWWICQRVESSDLEETFNDVYLSIALVYLATPSRTNLELLMHLRSYTSMFESYIKTISAERLRQVIATLKRPFIQPDNGQIMEKYLYKLNTVLKDCILNKISSEQWKSCQREFADLYLYYLKELPRASEDMANFYEGLLIKINNGFDGGVFTKISIDYLRRVIASLKQPFNQPDNGMSLEEYMKKLENVVKKYYLGKFSSEQWGLCRPEFTDLYLYYMDQLCSVSKLMADFYYALLKTVNTKSNGNIFMSKSQDLESLRRGLKIVCDAVSSHKFNSMYYIHEAFELTTCRIVNVVKKNGHMLEQLLDDLMQTVIVVAKGRNDNGHLMIIGELYKIFNGDEVKAHLKNKSKLFEKYCPLLTDLGNTMQGPVIMGRFVHNFTTNFLQVTSGGNAGHFKLWVSYIMMCVRQPHVDFVKTAAIVIGDNKKILKWKENVEAAISLFDAICGELRCHEQPLDGDINELPKSDLECLLLTKVAKEQAYFMKEFLNQIKIAKLLPHLQESLVKCILDCLESRSPVMFDLGKDCLNFIELQENNKDLVKSMLVTFDRLFRDEEFPWDDHCAGWIGNALVEKCMQPYKDGKDMVQINDLLISLFLTAMNKDHIDYDNGNLNVFGLLLMGPMTTFVQKHKQSNTAATLKPMLGDMLQNLSNDDDTVQHMIQIQLSILAGSDATLLAPHIDTLFDHYLKSRDPNSLPMLRDIYPANPNALDRRFQELMDTVEEMDSTQKMYFFAFISKMAENNCKVFTERNIEYLLGEPLDNTSTENQILDFLWQLSQKSAIVLKPHVDKLARMMSSNSVLAFDLCPLILCNVGAVCKDETERIYKAILKELKAGKLQDMSLNSLMNSLRTLIALNPEIGRGDQTYFQELGERNPSVKDMCRAIDNVIEGRSLEKATDDLEQQALEIDTLDNRVTETEDNVASLDKEVGGQRKDISFLRTDVDKHGERLFRIQEVVDETVLKVEEIDMKTISNAPAFSRQISKLLNPESEHDWRILAQRLGYSVDDIRGWATQSDPCMVLLSEWYSTHRTSEATHAVLKTLKEINRVDAAEIVDKWLESVKNVIDDEPPEYATPPPVFLSYQWGHQAEVKLLRKHLGMAGYECWMDVGQMGGGDKLFAKIDQGIRAAKLVICCVTEKYALSPNCKREVTLAINLGKQIIPLLVESLSWPPPGSMGPIFSEYLYIRFFLGENESHPPGIIWPVNSFQELLMQLNYHKIMPEQNKVTPEYENWWQPPDEEIIIPVRPKKGDNKTPAAASSETQQTPVVSPEVFLSYQWGMQPQVKDLYKHLTSHGYRVWLDIRQMGGGDSLYDKIEKGIRGCRVIVSCVTENYAKSVNCRREVSLADGIKKPIVPLLLEISEWPPKGPMGMVFSQLLYIDMTTEVSTGWGGEKFDELVGQLRGYIPEVEPMQIDIAMKTPLSAITSVETVTIETSQSKSVAIVHPSSKQQTKSALQSIESSSNTASRRDPNLPTASQKLTLPLISAAVQPSSSQEGQDVPQSTESSTNVPSPNSSQYSATASIKLISTPISASKPSGPKLHLLKQPGSKSN